jgi:hypothetical protein
MWEFEVDCRDAGQVYLVKHCDGGLSSWIKMSETKPGRWRVATALDPGQYRFSYFKAEGETFLNCGTFGLRCQRLAHDEAELSQGAAAAVGRSMYAQPA